MLKIFRKFGCIIVVFPQRRIYYFDLFYYFEYCLRNNWALALIINFSIPFMCVASVGTRSLYLLSTCIGVATFGVVESTSLLACALLNGVEKFGQWMIVLSVDMLTLATLVVLVLALNVRQREKAALHSVMLITNKKGGLPLLV